MRFLELIKKYAEAKETISNWAKEGGEIVRPQIAYKRAEICMACPCNIKKGIASRIAAKLIRWSIELKNGVSLKIPNSKTLGRCSACFCESELKVFLPLKNIKPPESERMKFDTNCWLFKTH